MARNLHKYEEMMPYEFEKEKERASIVYVATGPLEYHEECNVLGADTNKGYDWCLAAAEITGGIVFPMVPIAPGGARPFMSRAQLRELYKLPHHREGFCERFGSLYPGVFFSRETCRALYTELLEVLADELAFKLCVFIGSHGPAGKLLKDIMMEETGVGEIGSCDLGVFVGNFHGMRVMTIGSTDYNRDVIDAFSAENGIRHRLHGGLWEAALNYAINPEYYQPELLDETKYPQHFGPLLDYYAEVTNPGDRPPKYEFSKFTPEYAKLLRDTTVKRLAEDVLKNYKKIMEE